jgi:tRNA (guanine37-N1)-methyltransferase
MHFDIITLFPEMFTLLDHSITGKAQKKELASWKTHYLRDYAINDYGQVDDSPYGGEAGMVIRPEPLAAAIQHIKAHDENTPIVFLTPQGKVFNQEMAKDFSQKKRMVLLCGHYKGIDERIRQKYITHEVSIGDFVLTGGELGAMVMIDAITRLLPGVLGNRESAENDSHYNGLLSWPVYTRPETFEEMSVPSILLSGHHKKIQEWQRAQSLQRTQEKRPDLYKKYILEQEEHSL